jgi:hypothetical protein
MRDRNIDVVTKNVVTRLRGAYKIEMGDNTTPRRTTSTRNQPKAVEKDRRGKAKLKPMDMTSQATANPMPDVCMKGMYQLQVGTKTAMPKQMASPARKYAKTRLI